MDETMKNELENLAEELGVSSDLIENLKGEDDDNQ